MDYFLALVRKLAEGGHSQAEIADILNERELLRADGQAWQQFSVSRFMSAHGIKPAKNWRGSAHSQNNNNKGLSDEQTKARVL